MCKSCLGEITPSQLDTKCVICGKPLHKECAIIKDEVYCDTCYLDKSDKVDSAVSIAIPDVIRRSYIQTYKDCPYQFYKEVIEGVEVPMGSHAQVGIDFHKYAEMASKGEINSPEELIKLMDNKFKEYDDEMFERDLILYKDMTVEGLRNKLWQQCCESAHTLFDVLKTLPTKAYDLEKTIEFSVGEDLPKVSITMDRVDLIDDELEVTDWKTGTVMVGKKLSSDLQAPLYIKVIQTHYNLPVRKFTFRYLSENKERTFERIDEDNYVCTVGKRQYKINLTDAIREVQHIFSQIKNGNFNIPINTEKMYYTCKVCGIGHLGQCEGADIQVWKQYN